MRSHADFAIGLAASAVAGPMAIWLLQRREQAVAASVALTSWGLVLYSSFGAPGMRSVVVSATPVYRTLDCLEISTATAIPLLALVQCQGSRFNSGPRLAAAAILVLIFGASVLDLQGWTQLTAGEVQGIIGVPFLGARLDLAVYTGTVSNYTLMTCALGGAGLFLAGSLRDKNMRLAQAGVLSLLLLTATFLTRAYL